MAYGPSLSGRYPEIAVSNRETSTKAERLRRLIHGGCHSPGDDNALGSMPSHGPGCAGRVRDSRPSVYARPPQAPLEVIQKCLFSAEEMGRPSNVDPNAIRAVCRHKRAVAHAPGREPGEPFVIGLGGSFGHVKLGHERLRMSNRETSRRPSACAALSAATMTRRGPIFVAMTSGLSRGGASPVFFR